MDGFSEGSLTVHNYKLRPVPQVRAEGSELLATGAVTVGTVKSFTSNHIRRRTRKDKGSRMSLRSVL